MRRYVSLCEDQGIGRSSADDAMPRLKVGSVSTVVPQIDHRTGECLQRVVHVTDALEAQQTADLPSQAKTRSMVLKRSSKIAGSKLCLRPRFGVLRPRGSSRMFGVMPRLKISRLLSRQS